MAFVITCAMAIILMMISYNVGGNAGFQAMGGFLSTIAFIVIWVWKSAQNMKGIFVANTRNRIIAIDSSEGNPVKLLANLPKGYSVNNQTMMIEKTNGSPNRFDTWLGYLGLAYKGFPPLKVHTFNLWHERVNPFISSETKIEDWIERDEAPVPTKYLLFDKMHSFAFAEVEFRGGRKAHIMLSGGFRSMNPLLAIYDREGKFYSVIWELLEGALGAVCATKEYDDFANDKAANERQKVADQIASLARNRILQQTGEDTYFLTITRYNAASAEEEGLQRAVAAAEIRKQVAILEAEGQVADITILSDALVQKFPTADPNIIIQEVSRMATTRRLPQGLQALGSNAVIGIGNKQPNSGNRKKGNK